MSFPSLDNYCSCWDWHRLPFSFRTIMGFILDLLLNSHLTHNKTRILRFYISLYLKCKGYFFKLFFFFKLLPHLFSFVTFVCNQLPLSVLAVTFDLCVMTVTHLLQHRPHIKVCVWFLQYYTTVFRNQHMLELKPQFPWRKVSAYNDTPHEVISFMNVCVHVCQHNVITSRQTQ